MPCSLLQAYTKLRTRDLEDDLKNVDPSLSEEKKYLENELISTNRTPSNYFKDPWNIIDIVCYSNIFILILLHSIDVAFHFESLALWTARYHKFSPCNYYYLCVSDSPYH